MKIRLSDTYIVEASHIVDYVYEPAYDNGQKQVLSKLTITLDSTQLKTIDEYDGKTVAAAAVSQEYVLRGQEADRAWEFFCADAVTP